MDTIYFAQIREDAEVERALLRREPKTRLAVIASGGCTAFSLLDDAVEVVYAIDGNPAQAALVELKKVALERLDRASFLALLGEAPHAERLATYRRLADGLSESARRFWDAHPELVALGLGHCGVTERFYRFLGENLRRSVLDEAAWSRLFACERIEAQVAFFNDLCDTPAFRMATRVLLSRTTHLAFYPPFMFAQAAEHHFGDFFHRQLELELRARLVRSNYFLSQVLYGRYLLERPEGMPAYLSEAGYARAARNASKLVVVAEPLEVALPRLRSIDAFFLSNVFDWADAATRDRIVRAAHAAHAPFARFLFRNMLAETRTPPALDEAVHRDEALEAELRGIERSMLYRAIVCGVMP